MDLFKQQSVRARRVKFSHIRASGRDTVSDAGDAQHLRRHGRTAEGFNGFIEEELRGKQPGLLMSAPKGLILFPHHRQVQHPLGVELIWLAVLQADRDVAGRIYGLHKVFNGASWQSDECGGEAGVGVKV